MVEAGGYGTGGRLLSATALELDESDAREAVETDSLLGHNKIKGKSMRVPAAIAIAPRIRLWALVAALGFVSVLLASLLFDIATHAGLRRHDKVASPWTTPLAPPHVVFFVADDQGWNDVGYQSTDLNGLTPTIDSLAASGIKLTAYYTESTCTPARASLLTGLYTIHTGMQHFVITSNYPFALPIDLAIMPQYFKVRLLCVSVCLFMNNASCLSTP
jgi:hypothetical protein